MATPGREYSLDYHLLESMKFSGIEQGNLADLVSIVVSLKNKYGIVPARRRRRRPPHSQRLNRSATCWNPSRSTRSSTSCSTFRVSTPVTIVPRGIPKSSQFDVDITLGG